MGAERGRSCLTLQPGRRSPFVRICSTSLSTLLSLDTAYSQPCLGNQGATVYAQGSNTRRAQLTPPADTACCSARVYCCMLLAHTHASPLRDTCAARKALLTWPRTAFLPHSALAALRFTFPAPISAHLPPVVAPTWPGLAEKVIHSTAIRDVMVCGCTAQKSTCMSS